MNKITYTVERYADDLWGLVSRDGWLRAVRYFKTRAAVDAELMFLSWRNQ